MRTPPLRIDPPDLDPEASALSKVEQVVRACRQVIERQRSGVPARLPPVRQLASRWGVSCDTVVRAYEQLAATGWVEARHGSGYFVKGARLPSLSPGATDTQQRQDDVSRLDFMSRQLSIMKPAFAAKSRSGVGSLPASWLHHERIATKLRELGRREANWSDYPDPQGYLPLRQFVASHVAESGIETEAGQVLLTTGASEALQLVLNVLVRRSEGPVLYEDPCSPMLGELLMSMGLQCELVARHADGPDLDALEALCDEFKPQAFIINPLLHNPTGSSLSASKARRLARLVRRHQLMLIEDDSYGDLAEPGAPRLSEILGLESCVYVGSFSKTVSPALRSGYVIATPERIKWLTIYRMVGSLGGSLLSERVLYSLLRDGGHARHCERLRQQLAQHRPAAVDLLRDAGLSVSPAGEGLYLWAQLPEPLDATVLATELGQRGHVLAPGRLFSPLPVHRSHLRFNVAETAQQPTLGQALARHIRLAQPRSRSD